MVPPRLLGGAAVLFWGAMTEEYIVALIVAILLEARNWIKWSWDFDDAAYVKAFQVSLGLLGFVLFLVWMGDVNYNSLNQVIKWFPMCLLPVELAQRYGRSDHMKMNTFFYFARQRMRQDIKEGKEVDPNVFNTGYSYIFVLIIVASCNNRMDILTQALMLALIVWIIISVSIQRGLGIKRLIWAVPLLIVSVVFLQVETLGFYKSLKGKFNRASEQDSSMSRDKAKLGKLGNIKQSKEIKWRAWGDNVPKYLRINNFNKSFGIGWQYSFQEELQQFENLDEAFESGGGIEIDDIDFTQEVDDFFIFRSEHRDVVNAVKSDPKLIRIRGSGESDDEQSVVPSAIGLYAISNMHGEDVKPAVHPLGVLQLVNRKAVIDYQLWVGDLNRLERAPDDIDLQLDGLTKDGILKLSREIGLSKYSTAEQKVNAISRFFMSEFTYSLYHKTPKGKDQNVLQYFMHESRKGHCEYFATTAALLLREQGIPTRYCVGYVAREKSGDTWIMRGTHAHAWCSAWINGAWEIVDLTPPDWLDIESDAQGEKWSRGIKDWFQNVKQDFLMWRTHEANKANMNKVILGLMATLLGWVAYRLYKARKIDYNESEYSSKLQSYDVSSDLIFIEGEIEELIGKRPQAQTYYRWVMGGEDKLDGKLFSTLRDLVSSHEESRFGGKDKSIQMAQLGEQVKSLLKK